MLVHPIDNIETTASGDVEEPITLAEEHVDHLGQPVYLCDAAVERLASGEVLVLVKGEPRHIVLPNGSDVRLAGATFEDKGGLRLKLSSFILLEPKERRYDRLTGARGDKYVSRENALTSDHSGGTRLIEFGQSEIYEFIENYRWG